MRHLLTRLLMAFSVKEDHKLLISKLYGHISLIQRYFIHFSSELNEIRVF